jgi:4-diphosphocytidyl-2-C-methyl-D-erythritol kinase
VVEDRFFQMNTEYSAVAYAKINLHLSIGPRAEDGYHPIASLFQSVSLADRVSLTLGKDAEKKKSMGAKGLRLEDGESGAEGCEGHAEQDIIVEGDFDCPFEDTTVYKAARLFSERYGIRRALTVVVQKGIPAMAGLGGGSADAAAVLVLLNKAFGLGLDTDELAGIGLSVGSDVPFFFRGGAVFVHGRGEAVEPLKPLENIGILLICPSFGVSTGWAYAALDALRAENGSEYRPIPWGRAAVETERRRILDDLKKNPRRWSFKNDFSSVLYREYPVYEQIEALLYSLGASFVEVSGSGSTMFGIFDSPESALQAKERISGARAEEPVRKLLYGMALHAIKPLETSLRLG